MAASDSVGETTFYITRTNVGLPTDSSSCQGFRDQVEEYRLPTTTLDEFMAARQLPRLDLVKIDAEAAESKVLRGALATIQRDRPFIIGEVLEDVDHTYVEETLRSARYHFYHITRERLVRHERLQGSLHVEQRNYLFAPAENEAALGQRCAAAGILLG
jgi:Methyltransferase FkbM domain